MKEMKEMFNYSANTPQEPKLIGITQLSKRWSMSRHHIWNQIQKDTIPAVKSGTKWFIPMSFVKEFEKLVEQRSKEVMENHEGDSN